MIKYDNNEHTNRATCSGKHLYVNGVGYVWELQIVQNPKHFMYIFF